MVYSEKKMKQVLKYGGFFIFLALTAGILLSSCCSGRDYTGLQNRIDTLESWNSALVENKAYTQEASNLIDYYYKNNICMRFKVVKEMLKAIDQYLPHYFPDGPYTREDFIAIALTETTNLDQYTVGGFGERGLFQIMPNLWALRKIKKNHFDVHVNTEMAIWTLNEKYKKHKEYRKAIIAYNGYIVRNGKLIDKYYVRFMKYRRDMGFILLGKERK
jgi:hypothetical protein